jgi:hypothetical protein
MRISELGKGHVAQSDAGGGKDMWTGRGGGGQLSSFPDFDRVLQPPTSTCGVTTCATSVVMIVGLDLVVRQKTFRNGSLVARK